MGKFYSTALLFLFGVLTINGQTTTVTYSAGHLDTEFANIRDTATVSSCPGVLNVAVPAGRYVTSVDVAYSIEAMSASNAWRVEQFSYLECTTTNNKENQVSNGSQIFNPGIEAYSRTGLNIANGIVPSGGLQFELHTFRDFTTTGANCSAVNQRVLNNTWTITVHHIPAPTCPPPGGLQVTSTTANSATLTWTSGGAANWQLEYGPPGFTSGSGTIVNASTNPYTLTGINNSTSYEVRVRDSCGLNNVSFWSSSKIFRTLCSTISAPYFQNFESIDWNSGSTFSTGTIDTCWTRNHTNHFTFKAGPPQFTSTFTGPSGDHTTGSGKYIFSERVAFGAAPMTAEITSPIIDLAPLNVPQLSFWYHMFGFNMGDMEVEISTNGGLAWTNLLTLTGQQQATQAEPWREAIINLSSYANQTINIRFVVTQSNVGGFGDASVDDFRILEAPTCPKPSNLKTDFVWLNRASLSWIGGGASDWEIEVGSPGFSPGSGTRIATTSNPASVSGLSPNTVYQAYVRDSCGVGDVSTWVGPVTFKTLCAPSAAPYSEDFSSSTFGPGPLFNDTGFVDPCWRRDNLTNYVWKGGPPLFLPFNTGPSVDHTSGTTTGKYAFTQAIGFAGVTVRESSLNTVLINLSTLTTPELTFWYHMFGANINFLEVYVNNGSGYTLERTITGQQQTGKADSWKEAIVNLSSYAGDTVLIQFRANAQVTGTASHIAIDDIGVANAPSCPKPQNLVVLTKTNSSVTLDWLGGGTATFWNIEYGSPGFTQGQGTMVVANSNPFTVTGLSANTGYEFYVRDSCGLNDVSIWVGPVSDTTDCNPLAAPWNEDFEGTDFTVGTFTIPGNINNCWDRDESGNYIWSTGLNGTPSFNTGPATDHTSGSGKFIYSEAFFGMNQNVMSELLSPLIDLSPLTIPELTFWYHMFGQDIDSLVVHVSDGSTWTREIAFAGQQQTSNADAWKEALIDLSGYANDTVKLRFRSYKSSPFVQRVDVALDDIDIHEQPTCPRPSGISVTATTANSATLSWTSGGASNWQVEYGLSGFVQGSGTIVNANSNPFVVTGLNGSTTYDFYIRDSCGVANVSLWVGPATASTLCVPLVAPFFENFEGPGFSTGVGFADTGTVASCWNRIPLVGYIWTTGPEIFNTFNTGPVGDHTTGSGKYIFTESIAFASPTNTFLETPFIDLSALTNPELSFWYHMFGSGISSLRVQIDDGSGYAPLTAIFGQQQTSETAPWLEEIVSLSAYANDTIRLRFRGIRNANTVQADISVDDIGINEAPSCPKPSALQVTGQGSNFLNISWVSGGATDWQLEYGPIGFAPGTGTLINVGTNPFTLNGLTPKTSYDIYVRDSCGAGDVSVWVGPVTDTTDCSVFSTPFTENFDGTDWRVSTAFNDPGGISSCWNRDALSSFFWAPGQAGTPSFNTGPSADHTTGFGKFMYSEGFNGTSTVFTSPNIDLNGLTSPELRFWYHMFGTVITRLKVEVFDGTSWVTTTIFNGQQHSSNTAPWTEGIASLSNYVNDTIKIRFVAETSTFGTFRDMAVDDIWIGESPTCNRPTNLVASNPTTTSIDISWSTGGATNWQVRYRESGSGLPFNIVSAPGSPFTLTGLQPSANYEIYVRDSCAAGDVSLWLGPVLANTLCGVVTVPYQENFDGPNWVEGSNFFNTGDLIDACWTRPTNTGLRWGTGFGTTASFNTGPDTDVSGSGKYLFIESNLPAGTATIETPDIYLPANLTNPNLYFSYHLFGVNITSFSIQVNNGSGWSGNLFSLSGQQQNSSADAWKQDSLGLANYLGDTIAIRFTGINNGFQGDLALDEIRVDGNAPICAAPANISFTNVAPNAVDVNWTSTNGQSKLKYYELAIGVGSTINAGVVTSPHTLNGLKGNTAYVVEVYDSCGAAVLSTSLFDTVTTQPCPVVTAAFTSTRNVLTMSFNSSTTLNGDSLYWDFGDGNNVSGISPSHLYGSAGTYAVTLIAFNNCGTSDTILDSIQVCDTLLATFTNTIVGDSILFDAGGSLGASGFIWDFGDGNTGTGLSLKHIYAASGTYTVTLTAFNTCGDTLQFSKTVKECKDPIASWTYTILAGGGSGMRVQFDASASQNATQFEWDFGDGNTNSGTVQPLHIYAVPSLQYTVRLIVENECGEDDTLKYRLDQVGIEEYSLQDKVDIYPNPVNDRLTLEWDNRYDTPDILKLFDQSGRLVYILKVDVDNKLKGNLTVDVSNLSVGFYTLMLSGKDVQFISPVIIQR